MFIECHSLLSFVLRAIEHVIISSKEVMIVDPLKQRCQDQGEGHIQKI